MADSSGTELKIGDVLYRFDGNRRVYRGRHSAPVYEEHFASHTIVSETPRSWVTDGGGYKVNKKDLSCPEAMKFAGRGFFTKAGMEADIWQHVHRHQIERSLSRASVEQLKEVARIVGYEAPLSTEAVG